MIGSQRSPQRQPGQHWQGSRLLSRRRPLAPPCLVVSKIGSGITITNGVISVASSGGGGSSVNVVNALTSTSATDALSANQGKVLKGLIDAIPPPPTWSTLTGKPTTFRRQLPAPP